MVERSKDFDLSSFLTDSLTLGENLSPGNRLTHELPKEEPWYKHLYEDDPLTILGETGDWKPIQVGKDVVGTPTQEFYRDLNVLITGGTGFVGKVLFQKILRAIPHIGKVFLLIRSKKGKSPHDRLHTLLEDKLFLRMKAEVPGYLDKIRVVEGDLAEEGLGLSSADRQLLIDNVHVVFHSAADVRFIEPLKSSVTSNVVGSQRVLQLAKQLKNLKSYVHVSTAYSHCVRRVIEEKCYTMNVHYKDIVQAMNNKTDKEIEQETDRMLEGWPNTYTFSKALCENMVEEEGKGLPLCIYRPTVIWPTYKDPVEGYTDNIYGPNGMLMGMGMGVIHIYKVCTELGLDCVPVDLVVNSLIVIAKNVADTHRDSAEVNVYNFSATPQKTVLWKFVDDSYALQKTIFPLPNTIWHQFVLLTENETLDNVGHFFLHKIPGLLLDRIAVLAGQKPRLSKVYEKINFLKKKLDFFLSNHWEFHNGNVTRLWQSLEPEDKTLFPFDCMTVDFRRYLMVGKLGLRYYYLKEDMSTLPAMSRKMQWFKWAHYTLVSISSLLLLKTATVLAHIVPI